jgi:hypothetical protein
MCFGSALVLEVVAWNLCITLMAGGAKDAQSIGTGQAETRV